MSKERHYFEALAKCPWNGGITSLGAGEELCLTYKLDCSGGFIGRTRTGVFFPRVNAFKILMRMVYIHGVGFGCVVLEGDQPRGWAGAGEHRSASGNAARPEIFSRRSRCNCVGTDLPHFWGSVVLRGNIVFANHLGEEGQELVIRQARSCHADVGCTPEFGHAFFPVGFDALGVGR